jgi:peptidoglycan/xylan/chitin deacetylase (PgdA/CDA1 family)
VKLSVVIATYNRRALLSRTLPTLFNQRFPPEEYEVVVADDGSSDGTAAWLRSLQTPCKLVVLEQPHGGQGAAHNAGLRAASGDLVLFLDDDLLCSPELLQEHSAAHAREEPLVVAGPILISSESPPGLATAWAHVVHQDYYQRILQQPEPRWPQDATVFANCSAPRSVLLAAGGFDDRFTRGRQDTDLGLRLWKQGLPFRLQPAARCQQLYLRTAEDLVRRRATCEAPNELLLCRLHPGFRPFSDLAVLAEGGALKRLARQAAIRSKVSPDLPLRSFCWIAEKLRFIPAIRRAGVRLFQRRLALALFRGAHQAVGSWQALTAEFGRRLPVLLYHRIGPAVADAHPELNITPAQFERQLRWLARNGYTGIRPSDWLAWRQDGKALPEKPVLLSFDDAYADLVEHAFPLLRRYGFSAVVFVVTAHIGGTNRWDESQGVAPFPLMTAEQIREWAGRGIEFAAHSRTHPNLTTLEASRMEQEVAGSGEDLAALLGAAPVSFAYPYGEYNQAALAVAEAHYPLAFSCDEGVNALATDSLRLRRTSVLPRDSLLEFACRVRWGFNPIWNARIRLRPRTRLRSAVAGLRGESG